jgi:FkbM family methyltransferase
MSRFNIFTKKYKNSYSQCGEDMIVDYIFRLRGIKYPSYIDIGSSDPYKLSNTAFFYEKGCSGLNIEPNMRLYKLLVKHRSKDINLNFAIGEKCEILKFYIFKDHTLSTFSFEEYSKLISAGAKLDCIQEVEVQTLNYVMEKYLNGLFPDFMSLDVEGFDFKILQSINYDYSRPKVICVESAEYSPRGTGIRRADLIHFLEGKNYYEYANTNLNAIMVDRNFWFV